MHYEVETVTVLHGEIMDTISREVVGNIHDLSSAVLRALGVPDFDSIVIRRTTDVVTPFDMVAEKNRREYDRVYQAAREAAASRGIPIRNDDDLYAWMDYIWRGGK